MWIGVVKQLALNLLSLVKWLSQHGADTLILCCYIFQPFGNRHLLPRPPAVVSLLYHFGQNASFSPSASGLFYLMVFDGRAINWCYMLVCRSLMFKSTWVQDVDLPWLNITLCSFVWHICPEHERGKVLRSSVGVHAVFQSRVCNEGFRKPQKL